MGAINDATLAKGVFAPLGLCYIVGQGFVLHGGYNAVIRNVRHLYMTTSRHLHMNTSRDSLNVQDLWRSSAYI